MVAQRCRLDAPVLSRAGGSLLLTASVSTSEHLAVGSDAFGCWTAATSAFSSHAAPKWQSYVRRGMLML